MQEGKDWVLCVDSTYQTNVEDTPLMFFGSSTKEGKFNGIGAVLSNREDTTAFKFLFETVKEIAEPAPLAIMADADKAISRAISYCAPHLFLPPNEECKAEAGQCKVHRSFNLSQDHGRSARVASWCS